MLETASASCATSSNMQPYSSISYNAASFSDFVQHILSHVLGKHVCHIPILLTDKCTSHPAILPNGSSQSAPASCLLAQ